MTVFFDDFERANGAPGGNWVVSDSHVTISGGYLTCSTTLFWAAYNTTLGDGSRNECTATIGFLPAALNYGGVAVKTNGVVGYSTHIAYSAPTYYLQILKGNLQSGTVAAQVALPYAPPGVYSITLVWDNGLLTATIPGFAPLTFSDGTYAANTYMGCVGFSNQSAIGSIRMVGGTPPLFSVAPTILGNYGACVPVTFTGTNSAWTPGTPGSPTFTVDHGTLSAQTVLTATSATATYCPGSFLGTATFTDPTSGATATALVTSDPAVVPPGGLSLSAEAIAYIERSAAAQTDSIVLNRTETAEQLWGTFTVTETLTRMHQTLTQPDYPLDGSANVLALIIQVFNLLNGGNDWGGAATVFGNTSLIKSDVESLATALADLQGPGGVSLAVLAAALADLRGTGSPSLADVLAAASGGDSSAVLAAIAAVRGAGSPDLRTLADLAEGMRTVHGYDLASVKSWIDALPQTQSGPTALLILATVAALALAIPSGGASIAAEAVAIGAGPLLDLTTLVEVASLIGTLAGVASDVASIRSSLTTPVNLTAPIWPGLDHATVGASVAIADGLQVAGPLDGLLIHLTTVPAKAGRYAFGDLSSWKYVGAVVFKSDRGDWEWNHPIGLDSQIVTPKAMTHAAAARLRINGGFEGTVRPFTVTA